ncbi:uncharacterized protein LOC119025586 isoform X2 [Acanthopagrus latus]|uniref:uncharacterized protein LOC119025586 isoform X2 n=1 Tax=Acanthopagrus latus TaxID=8177 RepID=UPI00187C92F3|nr:uncharacterized protein LOC119025586 isoform X2 [Acanthopagrus latus]
MIEWLLLQTELPTFCSRPSQVTVAGGGTAELICPDMSSTILLILLLSAHITGLISEQLLRAAVGGSVLIPCSLHDNRTLSSVYWQEGEQHFFLWDSGKIIQIPNNKYENRAQVFHDKFSSGNISFRLDNISLEDDRKTFFAYIKFDKEKQSEERCRSTLQVSEAKPQLHQAAQSQSSQTGS